MDEKTKSVRVHNPEKYKEKVVRRGRGRKPVRNSSIRERIPKVTKDEIIVEHSQTTKRPEADKSRRKVINQSSDNIHFESNDLLDDFKK